MSVAKASRIVAAIDHKNEVDLVKFAAAHSSRETEREVARIKPGLSQPDRTRSVTENEMRLEFNLPRMVYEKLERAKNLQRDSAAVWQVLDRVLDHYLSQKDPVIKARKIADKAITRQKSEPNRNSSGRKASGRQPLTAAETHAVNLRDGGRCTHVGTDGGRCENTKRLEIHHVRPVTLGGGNELENLTTLCSFHHDFAHQLSLPIDGQVTWLREPRARYGEQLNGAGRWIFENSERSELASAKPLGGA